MQRNDWFCFHLSCDELTFCLFWLCLNLIRWLSNVQQENNNPSFISGKQRRLAVIYLSVGLICAPGHKWSGWEPVLVATSKLWRPFMCLRGDGFNTMGGFKVPLQRPEWGSFYLMHCNINKILFCLWTFARRGSSGLVFVLVIGWCVMKVRLDSGLNAYLTSLLTHRSWRSYLRHVSVFQLLDQEKCRSSNWFIISF